MATYDTIKAIKDGNITHILKNRACWAGRVNEVIDSRYCDEFDIVGNTTLLMLAAMYGKNNIMLVLIGAGADLNKVDDVKKTALMYAFQMCHPDAANTLLQSGASKSLISGTGKVAGQYLLRIVSMIGDHRTSDQYKKDRSVLVELWNAAHGIKGYTDRVYNGTAWYHVGDDAAGGAAGGAGHGGGGSDHDKLAKGIVGGIFAAHMMGRGHAIRYTPEKP